MCVKFPLKVQYTNNGQNGACSCGCEHVINVGLCVAFTCRNFMFTMNS
jgi:hypothetical protein